MSLLTLCCSHFKPKQQVPILQSTRSWSRSEMSRQRTHRVQGKLTDPPSRATHSQQPLPPPGPLLNPSSIPSTVFPSYTIFIWSFLHISSPYKHIYIEPCTSPDDIFVNRSFICKTFLIRGNHCFWLCTYLKEAAEMWLGRNAWYIGLHLARVYLYIEGEFHQKQDESKSHI